MSDPAARGWDALADLAPFLRVRPLFEDFCRFGGSWRAPHAANAGAAFHIVTHGTCSVEQEGRPTLLLRQGDVLLLPRAGRHVVYGGGGRHELREISVALRASIRVKQTHGSFDTELICGRLLFGPEAERLLAAALPPAIVVPVGELRHSAF